MSARTCLLCGKPLSRIWVGAGDDFCSREHGNQYRLKRGMDRLTEANKISSLMRSRENPKPVAAAHLPLNSASSRRDFPGMKISTAGVMCLPSLRPPSVSAAPRSSPVSARYLAPRLPRRAGPFQPRQPDSTPLRFSACKTAPVPPARKAALPVRIPRPQPALIRYRVLSTAGEYRGFGALRHAGISPRPGFGGMAPSRIELPGAACFLNTRRPRKIQAPPRTGSVRRLSRGFGFRRPARVAAAPLRSPAPPAIGLRISARGSKPLSDVRGSDVSSEPRTLESGRRRIAYPSFSARAAAAGIQCLGGPRVARPRPCHGPAPAVRQCGPLWNLSGIAGFPNSGRSLAAPQRNMPTPCLVAVPLSPASSNGAPHVSLAPFAPQNSPFGYKEYHEK